MQGLHAQFTKFYASATLRFYRRKFQFNQWRLQHGLKFGALFVLGGVFANIFALKLLQPVTVNYFKHVENLNILRTLLGGVGAALLGATAIAFSLVVFAMQINIERMPHGLFRRLSSDKKLLGSFLGAFLIALVVAAMSLIPNGSWALNAISLASWGTILILTLFLYAYRRALQLINPIEQLTIMSNAVRHDLKKWSRLADKAVILLNEKSPAVVDSEVKETHFNVAKAQFYKVNTDWNKTAGQAIHYAISYAKRFATHGDHEVTEYAFECIMQINASYCTAKHGTFVGHNPFFEVTDTTDSFINTSLELLRQTMKTALAGGDELLAGSTLRGIARLYAVYLLIDYAGRSQSKHHASLAASYLGSAVESIVPYNMPDLMMEGIRLMGKASILSLDHAPPSEIVSIANKISALSTVGIVSVNYQPVTLTAFGQLAEITYQLLLKGKHDIQYPVKQLRSNVAEAAKRFLATSDTPYSSQHCSTLGPYFSSTSTSSLRSRLTSLVNQLVEIPSDKVRASEIIANIETWSDQIYVMQKELLLLALQKRSSFTLDVIYWTVGISELLNALSNAPSCTPYLKGQLRKNAIWLISTLSFLPDEMESVTFVENYSFTEILFEAALNGLERDCQEFYENCKKLLMGWAKQGGRYQTGHGILEKAVTGLVALALREENPNAVVNLKTQFRIMLSSDRAPSMEARARTTARLAKRCKEFRHSESWHSQIENKLAHLNRTDVNKLIYEMAEILSSDTPSNPDPA